MYTANGAHLSWEEKEKGSIETGKLADMCVIEQDPLKAADSDLLTLNVDMTVVGGKVVYQRPGARA
jgi:predicted amidohydrolase YtcJ